MSADDLGRWVLRFGVGFAMSIFMHEYDAQIQGPHVQTPVQIQRLAYIASRYAMSYATVEYSLAIGFGPIYAVAISLAVMCFCMALPIRWFAPIIALASTAAFVGLFLHELVVLLRPFKSL
jgi:hypothetical protein